MGTGTLPSSVLTLCALLEKSTFYWEIILQHVIAVFLTIWGAKTCSGFFLPAHCGDRLALTSPQCAGGSLIMRSHKPVAAIFSHHDPLINHFTAQAGEVIVECLEDSIHLFFVIEPTPLE